MSRRRTKSRKQLQSEMTELEFWEYQRRKEQEKNLSQRPEQKAYWDRINSRHDKSKEHQVDESDRDEFMARIEAINGAPVKKRKSSHKFHPVSVDIELLTTEIFGSSYYCVGIHGAIPEN